MKRAALLLLAAAWLGCDARAPTARPGEPPESSQEAPAPLRERLVAAAGALPMEAPARAGWEAAADWFGRATPEELEAVRTWLASASGEEELRERAFAAWRMADLEGAAGAAKELVGCRSAPIGVRLQAAELLGEWGEEGVEPLLAARRDFPDPAALLRALGRTGDRRAIPALTEELARAGEPAVRVAAARALAGFPDREIDDLYRQLAADEGADRSLRELCVRLGERRARAR